MLPKVQHQDQQQQATLQNGVQVVQVGCTKQAYKLVTGCIGIITFPLSLLACCMSIQLQKGSMEFTLESAVLPWPTSMQ